jgi:simple sugar transport system permease protein
MVHEHRPLLASAVGSWSTSSPLIGVACGMAAVPPIALAQGILSIKLRANQIVIALDL